MKPAEPVSSPAVDALLDGLPATLGDLLSHPERHRPAVVERLLELTGELRRTDPRAALALAEAAQLLAARIPAFFPREERFRLRAKSFDVWGSLKRHLGDDLSAEGGFMAAFELLTQTGARSAESQANETPSPDLAAILGRHALLAGDRRDQPGVARYVEAGIEIAQNLDGDRPLATIQPLMEAIMEEENAVLPAMYTALSLVANTTTIPEGGGGETVGELVTLTDLVEDTDEDGRERTAVEVILRREAPAWGGLPWKISALIRLYSQRECDVALIHEVPSASAPGGWAVQDKIGWKVFDSDLHPDPEP